MKYKPFQKVKLKETCNATSSHCGFAGNMRKFVGKEVRISSIHGNYCKFFETEGCDWRMEDIESIIEEEDNSIESEMITSFDGVVAIAKEIFEEERVIIDKKDNCVIIHFPVIDICNSKGNEHRIHDMYLSFNIDAVDTKDVDTEGHVRVGLSAIRTTFTLAEIKTNYMHSHITPTTFLRWSTFCTGGSTPFAVMLVNIPYMPTRENWELLFLSLHNFLSWESLEGVPYISVKNLTIGENNPTALIEAASKDILPHLSKDILIFDDIPYFDPTKASFIEWVNQYSKLRDVKNLSKTTIDTMIAKELDNLKKKGKDKIKIGDNNIEVKILPEEGIEEGINKKVSSEVIKGYAEILNRNNSNFKKIIGYARAKAKQETFGEVGII